MLIKAKLSMKHSQRGLKKKILALLQEGSADTVLRELAQYPPDKLLNPLFSGICNADETIKWNAVTAMGATVARLADQDMEAARIVMRRFMWSLNDESGGIGWGAPEAIAECLANHAELAEEYAHILVSYMREDGFYLELPAHHQGLMWGIGRLAGVRPELLHKWHACRYLLPYLESTDIIVRALAARALGLLQCKEAVTSIQKLVADATPVRLYHKGRIDTVRAGDLATEALAGLES